MATIQRWGNSLAVRIPTTVAGKLGVRRGTEVEVVARLESLIISPDE